jgi:hypothetical protein
MEKQPCAKAKTIPHGDIVALLPVAQTTRKFKHGRQ